MENRLKDISEISDIKLLVDTFYSKVQQQNLIGPVFEERIADRWPEHLEKMYRFWQTVLLKDHTYFGSPFPPHVTMPISQQHFDAWLSLFNETVDSLFEGDKAEEAKWRAGKMAAMFMSKLDYYRNTNARPLV